MTDLRQAAQQALEALKYNGAGNMRYGMEAITALRTALEQPEQGPDRRLLQAAGTHPAPCARHCEAKAFEIEIRSLKSRLKQAQPVQPEPLEYWSAVEGWVKIDEVREHFDAVNCGTIYKHGGEGRVPLYTAPPQRTWVGLTVTTILNMMPSTIPADYDGELMEFARAVEAKLKELNK